MATAASKATSLTKLRIGKVEVPIALFSTVAKPGSTPEGFTTAGPHGGRLLAQAVARPVAESGDRERYEEPGPSDPLAVDEWEQAAAARVEGAPDQQTAAREALAAEAEGDARSRGLVEELAEPRMNGPEVTETVFDELGPGPGMERDAFEDRVEQTLGVAGARESFNREMEQRGAPLESWASGPSEVDGEYGRELVEEGTGEIVKAGNIRRGVRREDGRFIDCTAQLAEIDERTKLDAADVVAFVDATAIPRSRVKASYYVGTDDPKAPHALRIVYDGLRRTRRAAIVKLTKRSRQTLGAIVPLRDTLVLLELVFAEDFRPAPPDRARRHMQAEVRPEEVSMFCELVDAMSRPPRVMDELRDDAIALREVLLVRAIAGEVPETLVPPRPQEEQDVLAQLEASLAAVVV